MPDGARIITRWNRSKRWPNNWPTSPKPAIHSSHRGQSISTISATLIRWRIKFADWTQRNQWTQYRAGLLYVSMDNADKTNTSDVTTNTRDLRKVCTSNH